MARGPGRKFNALRFESAVADGIAPEVFVLQIAQGKRQIKTKKDREAYEAAKLLLPYRLPRLNNIDATNKNVDLSHEEFIKQQMEEEGQGNA